MIKASRKSPHEFRVKGGQDRIGVRQSYILPFAGTGKLTCQELQTQAINRIMEELLQNMSSIRGNITTKLDSGEDIHTTTLHFERDKGLLTVHFYEQFVLS